jgi:hypothetical protein
MITNDARCIRVIKFRIAMAKTAFSKKNALFTRKLYFRKKLVKCYLFRTALYGAKPLDTSKS